MTTPTENHATEYTQPDELRAVAEAITTRADIHGLVVLNRAQAVALAALLEGQAFQAEAGNPSRKADDFAATWRGVR